MIQETATPCYAWALMTNHVHLLLRTGTVPIATIMRRLLTGYAVRFNRRHGRYGHLFQNRYKSILCEEESKRANENVGLRKATTAIDSRCWRLQTQKSFYLMYVPAVI